MKFEPRVGLGLPDLRPTLLTLMGGHKQVSESAHGGPSRDAFSLTFQPAVKTVEKHYDYVTFTPQSMLSPPLVQLPVSFCLLRKHCTATKLECRVVGVA